MKTQDAINLLNIVGEINADTITKAYRLAAAKYHPDRNPGGLEMMKAINEAREALEGYEGIADPDQADDYGDELNAAINAAIQCEGLELEVCGNWLWVGGDTRTHKETLKAAGFKWASKKKLWHYRPDSYKSTSRGGFSMDDIRASHGSSKPGAKRRRAIAA